MMWPVTTASRFGANAPLWRNPRLALGLVLVVTSIVLGARLFDAADDSVVVWVVTEDVAAGQELTEDLVVARRVRFADRADADRYLSATAALPLPAVITRPIGAGELLPRGALGVVERLVEFPLGVAPELVPATVRVGTVVDVWLTVPGTAGVADSRIVFAAVPVLGLSEEPTGLRELLQVVVGLDSRQERALAGVLDDLRRGELTLVRRPLA
jgi:hypothetical protein